MSDTIKVSAPGKLIISGEHAVVYGYPALVAAINKRLTVVSAKGKIKINSEIPIGCGMGSSAAYAVAISAVNTILRSRKFDLNKINEVAYKAEKKRHGNPSGVDNTVSTYGGFIWYRKESEDLKLFSPIKVKKVLPKMYLIDTGRPIESTKEMVARVGRLYRKDSKNIEFVFDEIEKVTRNFLKYLLGGKANNFSNLIKENEKLLEKLGVVSNFTVKLIRKIEKIGGVAKISGAGGSKNRSGILLVYHKNINKLKNFARKERLELIEIQLGEEGVRIEK
jgi:mevalonate kinase